jgi:uncharacterized protein YcfJ
MSARRGRRRWRKAGPTRWGRNLFQHERNLLRSSPQICRVAAAVQLHPVMVCLTDFDPASFKGTTTMSITTKIKTIALTLGAAASALTLAAAPQASAGVVGCKASGPSRKSARSLGGLLGAVAGNKIAGKGDRGTGTAIGAVVGAGAGSAVGCNMQKKRRGQAGRRRLQVGRLSLRPDGPGRPAGPDQGQVRRPFDPEPARGRLDPRRQAGRGRPRARPSRPWAAPVTASGSWSARTASASATSPAPTSTAPKVRALGP